MFLLFTDVSVSLTRKIRHKNERRMRRRLKTSNLSDGRERSRRFYATFVLGNEATGGRVLVQGNFEGPSTPFGTILCMATFASIGAKNGTFRVCAAAYLENGDSLDRGHGILAHHLYTDEYISLLRRLKRERRRSDSECHTL
jgi:hypothetical protein